MAINDEHIKALRRISENKERDSGWGAVEQHARAIADSLRASDAASIRTSLGTADVHVSLARLLCGAFPDESVVPKDSLLPATYQVLRVLANFCVDNDENRAKLLDQEVPSLIVKLLHAYSISYVNQLYALDVSLDHLRVIKTALGVLINASLQYQPVAESLVSVDAPLIVVELSSKIHPSGRGNLDMESWDLRQGITSWSWKLLCGLRYCHEDLNKSIFDHRSLPYLTNHILFITKRKELGHSYHPDQESFEEELAVTELEALEESTMVLEGLVLDSETIRDALASEDLLKPLIDFIEYGKYPSSWVSAPVSEQQSREKRFDICKGALIKGVVAVAGETRNSSILWGLDEEDTESRDAEPSSWFVTRMLRWISSNSKDLTRDDLVICGTLCLGNLARTDDRATVLVQGRTNILPHLIDLLKGQVDIKVKNGAVGLLKNLSQPVLNRQLLGERGVIEALVSSEIWSDTNDMAEIVQGFGIGVCKHLANASLHNSLKMACPNEGNGSALEQIMAVVKRSDAVAIKSEGTRVLVNVIKSIFGNRGSSEHVDPRLQGAVEFITRPECSSRLAEMLSRSQKYPLLINESLVAMTLVAVRSTGEGVLKALVASNETLPVQSPSDATTTELDKGPHSASQALAEILKNKEGKYPPEIRANACSLITAVSKVSADGPYGEERAVLKQEILQSLHEAAIEVKVSDPKRLLQDSVNRALDVL